MARAVGPTYVVTEEGHGPQLRRSLVAAIQLAEDICLSNHSHVTVMRRYQQQEQPLLQCFPQRAEWNTPACITWRPYPDAVRPAPAARPRLRAIRRPSMKLVP